MSQKNREEILDEIRQVMAGLFELDPAVITTESRLGDDLDLDSIDAIDLIIKMQELSGQKVDQEAMREIRTVGDIVDLIERLTAHRS